MRILIILAFFISHSSYAKESRYHTSFINKSPFYKKEAKILMRFLSDDYLLKKEIHRVKLIAAGRMKSITNQNVKEMKAILVKNPLYMIMWPKDKNLIYKYVKRIEDEKRN